MLRRINLQNKLIISFTLLILVSFLILTLSFYAYIRNYIDRDYRKNMDEIAQSINNQLEKEVYNLDRIALGMLGNKEFIEDLISLNISGDENSNAFALKKYEYQKLVDKLIFTLNTPILTSPMISVINSEKDFFFSWSISGLNQPFIKSQLDNLEWEDYVISMDGRKVLLPPRQNEWNPEPDTVFSIARAIMTTKGQLLGLLEVQQKFSIMEDVFSPYADTWVTILTDNQGNIIYPLDISNLNEDLKIVFGNTNNDGQFDLTGLSETYLVSSNSSDYTGWTTIVLRSKQEAFKATAILFQFTFYSIIIVLSLVLVAVIFIAKTLTKPLRKLRSSMETVDIGQMDIKLDSDPGNDEIFLINRAFERMIERIDLSVKQKVQAQQEEARAYLLALQSQMNPHFLYNTLSTICFLADESNQEVIYKISTNLVDMLRYVSDYNKTKVTLQAEIKHAQQYLYLLKTRYEDNLSFEFITEGTPESIVVPKLILQPLVENSYRHGLLSVPTPWSITIKIVANNKFFEISVTDNGGGFSQEAISEIRARIASFSLSDNLLSEIKNLDLNNVGLFNTYSRLYLEYGNNVIMDIKNRTPSGSIVTIIVNFPPDKNFEKGENLLS